MPGRELSEHSLKRALRQWWKDETSRNGWRSSLRKLASELRDFLRDSTPQARRQRYGDVEFDWDYRVNTTSATVSFRQRLLGVFHSAYQPTEPVAFREMLDSLKIDLRQFTFIDLGSGKGRVLLMASNYPFRRILGVELFPELHAVANENIGRYHSASQQCFQIESVCGDARRFVFPSEPTVLYLFNPFTESVLERVIGNLSASLATHPRPFFLLYHNPQMEHILTQAPLIKRLGNPQYSIYEAAVSGYSEQV